MLRPIGQCQRIEQFNHTKQNKILFSYKRKILILVSLGNGIFNNLLEEGKYQDFVFLLLFSLIYLKIELAQLKINIQLRYFKYKIVLKINKQKTFNLPINSKHQFDAITLDTQKMLFFCTQSINQYTMANSQRVHEEQVYQNDDVVQSLILKEQQVNFEDDFYDQPQTETSEGVPYYFINEESVYPKNLVKKIQYKRIQKLELRNRRKKLIL